MSMRSSVFVPFVLAGAALVAACASKGVCPPTASATAPAAPDWQDIITEPDHTRLRDWRASLVNAVAQARKDGHGKEIDAGGPLFDPDIALDDVTLAPGSYRCRMIKLGAKTAGHATYTAYPPYPCVVRPGETVSHLAQTEGVQRPTGRLYPDGSARMVFLGVMVLSDEPKGIKYGRDNDRDLAGAVQRVGDARWRMVMPNPAWESMLDVMEITPAA
jgi:hypothetical protein